MGVDNGVVKSKGRSTIHVRIDNTRIYLKSASALQRHRRLAAKYSYICGYSESEYDLSVTREVIENPHACYHIKTIIMTKGPDQSNRIVNP